MRITGDDLPAVARLGEVPTPQAAEPDVGPPLVTPAAATGADAGTAGDRHPSRSRISLAFDPPLIAQRAVLGLPVGPLIAEYALAAGIDYGAASAAVDRAMPEPKPSELGEH